MRKTNPPFHVRPHNRSFRLCIKRHFAFDDPQLPEVRKCCSALLGERGWTLREASVTDRAARMVLFIQKAMGTQEEAICAGREIVASFSPRTRMLGHGHARRWQVTAPDGQQFEIENLLYWCRENEASFLPHESPGVLVQSGMRLADRVYQNLRDPRSRQWRGWLAVKLP